MNTKHPAYEHCFTVETAKHRANLLTHETGIAHTYEEISEGIFRAILVVDGADFLTGEKIPDEVRNKPKTANLQTVPTISLVDMMARKYVANWLIEDLIEQSDLGSLFGASGGGKSFVVLDMAYCIAAGIPYHGRTTKKTGVLYVCGEGHSGLQKRLKAIHIDKGCTELPNIHITTVPAAFIDTNSTIAIQNTINQIGNIGLVFVDTFHRNLGNGDENSAKDIAKFLQNIDLYLRSSGIAVVVVHHSGNESNGRSRGSSSIRAAMDVEYEVKKMGGGALDGDLDNGGITITVTNTKMKNFEQPKPFSFRFKPVAESVVLEPTDYVKSATKKSSLSNNELIALRCLDKVIEREGIEPPQIILDLFPDSPQNIPAKVVEVKKWRTSAYEAIPLNDAAKDPQDALRKAFDRVRIWTPLILQAYFTSRFRYDWHTYIRFLYELLL